MRAALLLGALLLAAAPAAAVDESEAASLRDDVLWTWHEPEVPQPHAQWHGFIQLHPATDVVAVHYQVCRVGQACFAPPTAAKAQGEQVYAFDTSDYKANGQPVDYQAGWRLGVKWFLDEQRENGTVVTAEFPSGPDLSSPECAGDAAMACSERHYFVFTMGGPTGKPSPGMGLPALLVLLAVALALASRSR